jgi:hypothetical protein
LFDSIAGQFLQRQCTGRVAVEIPARGVRVIVIAPAGAEVKPDGGTRPRPNGVVTDQKVGR